MGTKNLSGPETGILPVERVRRFVAAARRTPDLGLDDRIFGTGGLNSLFAMQLILFLEKTFSIEVGDSDLEWTNFESVRAIASLLARKQVNPPAIDEG